jgi:hypothetical protein
MKCPHCAIEIHFEPEDEFYIKKVKTPSGRVGFSIAGGHCPACHEAIVMMQTGEWAPAAHSAVINLTGNTVIYPRGVSRAVSDDVPVEIAADFVEASAVLHASPKASAALSRRILERVLLKSTQ